MTTRDALMNLGHLIVSHDGIVQGTNDAASTLLGLDGSQLVGRPIDEVWAAAHCSSFEATSALKEITSGVSTEREGLLIRQEDGKQRWPLGWRASRLLMEDGSSRAVLLFWEEVGRLNDSIYPLNSYRDTFVHAVEGIFRTTVDGRYLEANPALARMYGYDSPAALIHALGDLNKQLYVQPGRREAFIRQIQEDGYITDFESEIFRGDGTRIWISEYARTVRDHKLEPLYFEGSVIDITSRRLAEAALRTREERFRHIIETMNLVPWDGKLEGRLFTYVGPQAEKFLGFSTEEWLQEGFWQAHTHPDDRDWVRIAQEEALAKSNRFEVEYRMIHADGREVWVRDMMTAGTGPASRTDFLIGYLLDVTHRRSTEMALEKSRYFLDQLVGAFPVIVYLYDVAPLRCVYVSGQAHQILGYSGRALSRMDPLFLMALSHPDEVDGFQEHLERLISARRHEPIEREIRLRAKSGEWVWFRTREAVFVGAVSGESKQIIGVATDITARHAAWEELVTSEALFRSLVENSTAIPFEYDFQSDRFSYVGPQADALLGYPISRWYQKGFWSTILDPADKSAAMRWLDRRTREKEGKDVQTEGRVRAADGREVWIGQAYRCASVDGGRHRARGFLLDITRRKTHELQMEASRRLLRQHASRVEMAREEERIAVARELHDELGQALTLLNMDVARIQMQVSGDAPRPSDEEIAAKLAETKQMIAGTAETLRRILTNLRPPVLDEFGLTAAIEWQAKEFSRRAGLRCDVAVEPCEVPSDAVETAVFRIFQEVLTNIARHAHATHVKVSLRHTADQLVLEVSDNGQGFDVSAVGKKQSFGLLGIRERAAFLGGEVHVVSNRGKGTKITTTMPTTIQDSPQSQ